MNDTLAAQMAECPWLIRCGQPLDLAIDIDAQQVLSWSDAQRCLLSREWEMAVQTSSNLLSEWLFHNCRKEYNARWNVIADESNAYIEQQLKPAIWAGMGDYAPVGTNIGAAVYFDIKRSLCGAALEAGFADLNHPLHFFSDALKVFQAGHYPCGWTMPWPSGRLIVF